MFDPDAIPPGDVFIHCGDFCNYGSPLASAQFFNQQLGRLPHRVKIVISGNHETCFKSLSRSKIEQILDNATYLQDSGVDLGFAKLYGTPWIHARNAIMYKANAFSCNPDEMDAKFGSGIPDDVDILISHCPPLGILDEAEEDKHTGSGALLRRVMREDSNVKLSLFGHNHNGFGICQALSAKSEVLTFCNAAQKELAYPAPIVITYKSHSAFIFPETAEC